MNNNIKTIDIKALSWIDKVNGNTYFSALLTINYQLENERVYKIPFQYGYGSTYIEEAKRLLIEFNQLSTELPLWKYCNENNIILRESINNAKKKELKELVS